MSSNCLGHKLCYEKLSPKVTHHNTHLIAFTHFSKHKYLYCQCKNKEISLKAYFLAIEGFENCWKVEMLQKVVVLGKTMGMGWGCSVTANHVLGCTRTNLFIVYVCLAVRNTSIS